MPKTPNVPIEKEITAEREEAEAEIREKQKIVDYDIKEYPVEVLVQKYKEGLDEDVNELRIPDYQRDIAWTDEHQSRLAQSVIQGGGVDESQLVGCHRRRN